MNLSDKNFLRDVGYRIREQRLARSWTQADLASRCRLHRTFIGPVQPGERNLSIHDFRLIAQVLRVAFAELFDGQAQAAPPGHSRQSAHRGGGARGRGVKFTLQEGVAGSRKNLGYVGRGVAAWEDNSQGAYHTTHSAAVLPPPSPWRAFRRGLNHRTIRLGVLWASLTIALGVAKTLTCKGRSGDRRARAFSSAHVANRSTEASRVLPAAGPSSSGA
jgi:transcriptional regulator with XRE-family HTH domain